MKPPQWWKATSYPTGISSGHQARKSCLQKYGSVWQCVPKLQPHAHMSFNLAIAVHPFPGAGFIPHSDVTQRQMGGRRDALVAWPPLQRCRRRGGVRCPLFTAIARSALGCGDWAAVTAMASLPRPRASVGFELITAITAVRSTTRSHGVQFPNAFRRAGTSAPATASGADMACTQCRFEKCTELLRKLAWVVHGPRIVSKTPGRYSRLTRVRARPQLRTVPRKVGCVAHADQRLAEAAEV